jgi:hypothetical protein
MTLAIILGCCLLCPPWTPFKGHSQDSPANGQETIPSTATQSPSQGTPPASEPSGSETKTPPQTQSTPAAAAQEQPTNPTRPSPTKHRRRRRKSTTPNCLDPATARQPATDQSLSPSASADSTNLKPCPPKKTVVRNGGTDEPATQLTGSDPAKQLSQGTTARLLAATEENLKTLSGRELKADQQQTLNQIREFMEQSKQATAAGDVERGQNLASKARLLSDELVKP